MNYLGKRIKKPDYFKPEEIQWCNENGATVRELDEEYVIEALPTESAEDLSIRKRIERNELLFSSDWTQTLDAPLTEEEREKWAIYRQRLRDLPQQKDFPYSVVWPEK